MAASLGSLVVSLSAETAQFTNALNRASYTAQKNFKDITSFAKTAAGSLAALYGVGTFASFINQQIELADKLDDLSQKLGISAEELSKLQYAAKFSGVDIGGLQVALTRLSKGMAEAANETGTAYKALNAMGISVKNADGSLKSSTQVLGEVADAFAKYEDGAGKTALATTIFGRAGAELIPMLNEGSKGIKAYGDELQRFGAVVTNDAAAAAARFNDNLDRIKTVGTALGQSIANNIIPYLNKLAEEFLVARANGLGFLDMLDMGLRFGNYGQQIKKINEEIEGLQNRFSIFDLTGGKDERLKQLMNQKKALQELQSAAALTGKTYEDQISRRFMNQGTGKIAAPVPPDEAQMKKYMAGLGAAQDANSRFVASMRDSARQSQAEMNAMFMNEAQIKNQQNVIKIQRDYETAAIAITKQFKDGNLTAKDYREQIAVLSESYIAARDAAEVTYQTQEKLNASWEYGATTALKEYINQAQNLASLSNGFVKSSLRTIEDSLFGVVNGTMTAAQAFKNMANSIIQDLIRIQIRKQVAGVLGNILDFGIGNISTAFQYGTNIGSEQTRMLAAQNAGMRAFGGQVSAGKAYLVGERGAETFVPSTNGNIIPNSAMGGNVVVNQTIQIQTGVAQTVRTEVQSLMPKIMEATKAAVADSKRRGGSFGNMMS